MNNFEASCRSGKEPFLISIMNYYQNMSISEIFANLKSIFGLD